MRFVEAARRQIVGFRADPRLLAAQLAAERERLVEQLLPAAELAEMLRAAGAPSRPSEIGVSPEVLRDTYFRCRTIRRRYTVLDLAAETGVLESCVEELFAPGGFWA